MDRAMRVYFGEASHRELLAPFPLVHILSPPSPEQAIEYLF
jgi:hypothetical protein